MCAECRSSHLVVEGGWVSPALHENLLQRPTIIYAPGSLEHVPECATDAGRIIWSWRRPGVFSMPRESATEAIFIVGV